MDPSPASQDRDFRDQLRTVPPPNLLCFVVDLRVQGHIGFLPQEEKLWRKNHDASKNRCPLTRATGAGCTPRGLFAVGARRQERSPATAGAEGWRHGARFHA